MCTAFKSYYYYYCGQIAKMCVRGVEKIDMMLEILEISLICQNVKKQSIFKKNSISIIFFFSVVILYTVQFRWRKYLIGRMLHLFFHLYKRRIFQHRTCGGQFEKPLTPVGQQRGMGE